MKWYAIVHSTSRGDSWYRKFSMELADNENRDIVVAVLTCAGYFGKKEALSEYKRFKKNHFEEEIFFLGKSDGHVYDRRGGRSLGEEFNMGYGRTKEVAMDRFLQSVAGIISPGRW